MSESINVLLVEDSRADARLILEVLKEEHINIKLEVVRDGEEAMSYLRKEGKYKNAITPSLIILDLNLPRKDGREVLSDLKEDPVLKAIPVVVLTTSKSEEDIQKSYRLQASCYVTKPIDLDDFIETIRSLDGFWFSAVSLPGK